MSTLAPPDINLAELTAAILASAEAEQQPAPRIARRVTMSQAKDHFDAGGDVLVSEYGDKSTLTVGPDTTVHNWRSTTWKKLREQVTEWRNRYPNQRYFIIETTFEQAFGGPNPQPTGHRPLLARAEDLGRKAYTDGRPAAPAVCPEVMDMVRGWDVGDGAASVFEAFGRGFSAAADEAAAAALNEPGGQTKTERAEETHPTLTAAVDTALHKLWPGESKTAAGQRKKVWEAIAAELGEIEAYGLDFGGRIPIGDPIELGNAYIEVDGYGNAVTIRATEGGMPIWDPS